MVDTATIAVVIPAYRTGESVAPVIASLPGFVDQIVVVDDACPERSGDAAEAIGDDRVTVVRHPRNQGVGGAMVTGFRVALAQGADVIVKMDADGQMDPDRLHELVRPITDLGFDYAKGNRWYDLAALRRMPIARRLGNAALSFITKAASGYWNVYDPQNGYIAIRREMLERLDLQALDSSYFFENSMLVQLNVLSARVAEVAIPARYGDEQSSMSLTKVVLVFPWKLLRVGIMRIRLKYFGMDVSPIAVLLGLGSLLVLGGTVYGAYEWIKNALRGAETPAGTVMLAALPTLLGAQLLLNALLLDMAQNPPGLGIRRIGGQGEGTDPPVDPNHEGPS